MRHTAVAVTLAKRFAYACAALAGRIALWAAQEVDETGLHATEDFEACRLTAYRDAVGVLTIGWGHTGRDVYEGLTITRGQAEELLRQDLLIAEMAVNHDVTVALTQNQFDALVDFVFNVGSGHFASSTLLRKLNAGDYAGASLEFDKWAIAGGHRLPGLVRRRAAERELFLRDETVSLNASAEYDLRDQIQRVILDDLAEGGPISKALEGWQAS